MVRVDVKKSNEPRPEIVIVAEASSMNVHSPNVQLCRFEVSANSVIVKFDAAKGTPFSVPLPTPV